MKNITIISEEEREILLKNTAIVKGISAKMENYLEKHMGEKDMGIGKINPEDFLFQVNSLNQCIDEILEIMK